VIVMPLKKMRAAVFAPRIPFRAVALALALCSGASLVHADGVRAEIGNPLKQAGDLIRAGKGKEALAKVREADGVSGKTPAEQLMIDRMRAAAAQRAGDHAEAVRALEAIHPKTSGAEAGQIAEQIAASYAQLKNVPKANEWVSKAQQAGNNGATLKQLQSYLQGASGDYAAIAKDTAAAVEAATAAGKKPEEADLLRLADAYQRTGNSSGQALALEKLLFNYPKKDYWSAYLNRLPRKAGVSERLAFDVWRLKLETGNVTKTDDYMELAQLAIQAGLPSEGRKIVERGFASKALGTGAEADRHKRLKDLAIKREEEAKANIANQAKEAAEQKTGDDLVKVGYAMATLGNVDEGLKLIEQGIAKGGLKKPEDAKLRLGMAQMQKNRAKGIATLRSVSGNDGAADVARLWTLIGG